MEKELDLYRGSKIPWLGTGGLDGDVVLASKVRLVRNFSQLPFPGRATPSQLAAVKKTAAALLPSIEQNAGQLFERADMDAISPLEREALCAKHLIGRNLAKEPQHRTGLISDDRRIVIQVNGEDHLRIACMTEGLELESALTMALRMEDVFDVRVDMAFDEKLGYLASWPTNIGTGLRVSVLLHLPGLFFTDNLENIVKIAPQLGLDIRGFFSDGKNVVGNIYKVSNQLSLGYSEGEILANVRGAVQEIAAHERRARKALAFHRELRLKDSVWRAYGELSCARRMHSGEALSLISRLRLGTDLGIVDTVRGECICELLTVNREGYLKCLAGDESLPKEDVYRLRADALRETLEKYMT